MVEDAQRFILETISNMLSVITIACCLFQKIPQMQNIIKLKNCKGLNLTGLVLELCGYTIMFVYNYRNGYALMTYMEYPIILAQQIVLIWLVLYYTNKLNKASTVGACIYFSLAAGFLSGLLPRKLLLFLVPLCTPFGASAKLVQLFEIFNTKESESISLITWGISAFNNSARIFTVLIDSADSMLLLNYTAKTLLSSSVLLGAYYFKPKKSVPLKKVE